MPAKKQTESDEQAAGAPEWMVTFSDCMTLLLTFFVLLLSFSSFDENTFHKLRVIFGQAFPAPDPEIQQNEDGLLPTVEQIEPTEDLDEGSEKPTFVRGVEDNLKEETESVDFRTRKVFLSPSKQIFWGKGTTISSQGRKTLFTIASFLREVPSRVVISENGRGHDADSEQFGLLRAWAVTEYLTTKQGLKKGWFSISAASTLPREDFRGSVRDRAGPESERMLEIVLLERSIYN